MTIDIITKIKELGELCEKSNLQFFMSVDGFKEPMWNTVGEIDDVNERLHNFTDKINADLKYISNDCIRISYKDKNDRWNIKD